MNADFFYATIYGNTKYTRVGITFYESTSSLTLDELSQLIRELTELRNKMVQTAARAPR